MTTAQDQQSRAEPATFEAWWAEEGQFCRAGGGDYEKTFAHRAWHAARALPAGLEPVAHLSQQSAFRASPHGQDAEGHEWLEVADSPGDPGAFAVYTAAQVQAMLAAAKADMGIPVEIVVHERVLQPVPALRSPECWCECCDTLANGGWRSRMSLCPKCGDKRCPRAYHHNSDCSAP